MGDVPFVWVNVYRRRDNSALEQAAPRRGGSAPGSFGRSALFVLPPWRKHHKEQPTVSRPSVPALHHDVGQTGFRSLYLTLAPTWRPCRRWWVTRA
jgi:hypothetical protein